MSLLYLRFLLRLFPLAFLDELTTLPQELFLVTRHTNAVDVLTKPLRRACNGDAGGRRED